VCVYSFILFYEKKAVKTFKLAFFFAQKLL
jgi:hypothetical protein